MIVIMKITHVYFRFLQFHNITALYIVFYYCSVYWYLEINKSYYLYAVIMEKFTSQNFQFKIIQPKKFSSLKVINENFYG